MNAPVYAKLRDDIKNLIESRKMLPGESLPSENDLSRKYSISRSSVRLAMQELEAAGLIVKQQGKGSIVNDFNVDTVSNPKRKTIGIDLNNAFLLGPGGAWYYGHILKGVQEAVNEAKSRIQLISETDFTNADSIDIDGLIITRYESWTPEKIAFLTKNNIPVIVINRFLNDTSMSYLSIDDQSESYKAVEYLIHLGHERIAFIGSGDGNSSIVRRKKGYLSALKTYSIEFREELLFEKDLHGTRVREELEQFTLKIAPTAMLVANGAYCSILTLPLLSKLGIKIPADLSLICFDDMDFNDIQNANLLTCIKMPLPEMGRTAANHIMNYNGKFLREIFPAELIIRKSCQALNHKTPIDVE